ncbi:MAG: 50S ribosomal protein L15 [Spirochaetales bacterium]|nr:50S ribosomal protein L15 [Spirochaetales bacterium]MCP5485537.1 50S ribosomal protein L15 [Spirochaetales bacterium]
MVAHEQLAPPEGSRKLRNRVGRGHATGNGKTSGKGHKGQKARAGYSYRAGFEGGQMPLHRRLPKRGFRQFGRVEFQLVNLYRIAKAGLTGAIDPELLEKRGLIRDAKGLVKILGTGEVKGSLQLTADAFSEGARSQVEAAGGKCVIRERVIAEGSTQSA